ncbi:MAG: 50S ribosomal protein L15 [Micavibrio sp.]|nr:50S ribosomal protein L15 [Micavibrio sp.]|tara:strand:+ start:319 stop:864 length:546 start_codon:yes stop_codon:yes gene_type:complete
MKLNELSPSEGSVHAGRRVGRGIGSSKGKTAGSGHKGQKARKGVAINGYEGGQMPLYMRMPKRGFNAWKPTKLNSVSIDRLQKAIDEKKFDAKTEVTAETLKDAGVITRVRDGVKIIGNGELKAKLTFKVAGASKGALTSIEKAGGSVEIVEVKKPETVDGKLPKKEKKEKKAPAKKAAKK